MRMLAGGLSILFVLLLTNAFAQKDSAQHLLSPLSAAGDIKSDTIWFLRNACKSYSVITQKELKEERGVREITLKSLPQHSVVPALRKPFLSVHGNIQYDFQYRSFIDTPFAERNFQQHTVQTTLNIVLKDHYPLKVHLSTRQSNSPYFRDFMDFNFMYDRFAFLKDQKKRILDKIEDRNFQRPELAMARLALANLTDQYNRLKIRLKGPDMLQKIIEERERLYYNHSGGSESDSGLSLGGFPKPGNFKFSRSDDYLKQFSKSLVPGVPASEASEKLLLRLTRTLDSLHERITSLQKRTDSISNAINKNVVMIRQKIYGTSDHRELQKIANENGIADSSKKRWENFVSNVKSIGIGRSLINYSELTAWNVLLTGFNMEYNPGIYSAIAIGKVDYGFRDFFGKHTYQKGQNLAMGRIGIGNKDRRAIILSAFTGRKYSYSSAFNDTISNRLNVTGYSIEAILKKNENTFLSAEVAKTTKPLTGSLADNNLHNLVNFSDRSNLGVSVKGQTVLNTTGTRLSGFYKKTGESFQSFSPFTYNTDQTAWLLKVDQSFLKDKIGVIGMLRRNDFTNPFAEKTFKTSTIFKSAQVNIRVPKWPVVSAGYYPGTQLYIIDKERARENAYYILNGSIIHNYTIGSMRMVSSLIYNKYASKGTDSGFIAYKGVSYIAAHSILFPKFQLQGSYMFTDQEQMQFFTLEGGFDYVLSRSIRIGGGSKYNKVAGGNCYWGGRANFSIEVAKLGGLQLQYEKSYLPTIRQTLYPIEVGRVSWFKYF